MSSSAAVFPIIYGKFSAGVAKLKKLFAEVEKRRNGWPEWVWNIFYKMQKNGNKKSDTTFLNTKNLWFYFRYTELFNEIQQTFLRERTNLLNASIWATVTELTNRGKTGVDLCSTVRTGCIFCINVCQDEFRLFGDFFHSTFTPNFE